MPIRASDRKRTYPLSGSPPEFENSSENGLRTCGSPFASDPTELSSLEHRSMLSQCRSQNRPQTEPPGLVRFTSGVDEPQLVAWADVVQHIGRDFTARGASENTSAVVTQHPIPPRPQFRSKPKTDSHPTLSSVLDLCTEEDRRSIENFRMELRNMITERRVKLTAQQRAFALELVKRYPWILNDMPRDKAASFSCPVAGYEDAQARCVVVEYTFQGNAVSRASGTLLGQRMVATCAHGVFETPWDRANIYPAPCEIEQFLTDFVQSTYSQSEMLGHPASDFSVLRDKVKAWNRQQEYMADVDYFLTAGQPLGIVAGWGLVKSDGQPVRGGDEGTIDWEDKSVDMVVLATEVDVSEMFGGAGALGLDAVTDMGNYAVTAIDYASSTSSTINKVLRVTYDPTVVNKSHLGPWTYRHSASPLIQDRLGIAASVKVFNTHGSDPFLIGGPTNGTVILCHDEPFKPGMSGGAFRVGEYLFGVISTQTGHATGFGEYANSLIDFAKAEIESWG